MPRTYRFLVLAAGLAALAVLGFSGSVSAVGDRDVSKDRKGRVDAQGDPLPEGAVGRLGSVRLRHAGAVHRLAFLGTGQALASLGEDNVFHLWETATGKELRRLVLDLPRAMPANPECTTSWFNE